MKTIIKLLEPVEGKCAGAVVRTDDVRAAELIAAGNARLVAPQQQRHAVAPASPPEQPATLLGRIGSFLKGIVSIDLPEAPRAGTIAPVVRQKDCGCRKVPPQQP